MINPEFSLVTPPDLKFIKSLSWNEVKQSWKDDEDSPTFKREYTEHGHDTWESWRQVVFNTLQLADVEWAQYEISDPEDIVPAFRGGPFRAWMNQYYDGQTAPTFHEIVHAKDSDVSTRDKFAAIVESEKPIRLIGLERRNEVYVIEGMHRATAIALAASRGQKIKADVTILLAKTNLSEFEIIE